jgi:hypothetical protein
MAHGVRAVRRVPCTDHAYTCIMFPVALLLCRGFATTYTPFTSENLSSQISSAGHGKAIGRPNGELGFELPSEDEETIEYSLLSRVVSRRFTKTNDPG